MPIYVFSYSQGIILIILDAELYKLFDEKKPIQTQLYCSECTCIVHFQLLPSCSTLPLMNENILTTFFATTMNFSNDTTIIIPLND